MAHVPLYGVRLYARERGINKIFLKKSVLISVINMGQYIITIVPLLSLFL